MGRNSRFVLRGCKIAGGMASGGDGLTSPARSSVDGLFGGPDVDLGSDIPSPLGESVVGNEI